MATFNFNSITTALNDSSKSESGVDFSGKSLKLNTEDDAKPIVEAINSCPELTHLTLTGNTLGVPAAQAIAKSLETHEELKHARWSDMFTGRMKTEIPPALSALGDGMIVAKARLTVLDLSDNAFGPIGVQGLAKLLQSDVCSQLQELRLNNNGLGITGGKLLATALGERAPKLKTFIAGRNRLENEGAKALAAVFEKLGSLEEVAMPQNGIYHVGITALAGAFKQNPGLSRVNLNDNTIGAKGSRKLAEALKQLKNLKHVNFGDCLLKCKGALALAKGFKDNRIQLESLDLSNNEIGHAACLQIVEYITSQDCGGRLSKVVLAGNSLGDDDHKEKIRSKLGQSADLSSGEGSDEEYVTGSEEDTEESEHEGSEDSATEDAQHQDTLTNIVLDNSGIEEVESDVERFLQQPSLTNFQALGQTPVDVIITHLQIIKDPTQLVQAHVEATMKVSGLPFDASHSAHTALMYEKLFEVMNDKCSVQWLVANTMLVSLGLIKSESKEHKISWHLPSCYSALSSVINNNYFPSNLRETLRFFMKSKKEQMASKGVDLSSYPNLIA